MFLNYYSIFSVIGFFGTNPMRPPVKENKQSLNIN